MGHAVEPLVDGTGDVALPRDADFGEGLQAPLELGELGRLRLNLPPPPFHVHHQRDGERDQRQDRKAGEREQNEDGIEREAADCDGRKGHGENL